jgi:hypothetical protein
MPDFYRFQIREKRREEIIDHRKRNAKDLDTVKQMKKARRENRTEYVKDICPPSIQKDDVLFHRFSTCYHFLAGIGRACVQNQHHDTQNRFLSAVWETCTEYHCTPTKVFLKFSQSLRRPPTVATWLKITEPNLE